MYIPPSFAETDPNNLHDFIEQHSFATLVSHDGNASVASHLPLLLDREFAAHGRLVGHMARANSQWQTADGTETLAISHGPHAYISPGWYEEKHVVPTWNYTAVHVYGVLRIEEDRDQLRDIVDRYVSFYEADQTKPWAIESTDGKFIDQLLDAIVGFTIEIDRIEGKSKLSQNHSHERREKVIRRLNESDGEQQRQIAALMTATLTD